MSYAQRVWKKDKSVVIAYKCKHEHILKECGFELITQFGRYGQIVPHKGYGMTTKEYFKIKDRFSIMQRVVDGTEQVFMAKIKAIRSTAGKIANRNKKVKKYIRPNNIITSQDFGALRCRECDKKLVIRKTYKYEQMQCSTGMERVYSFHVNCCGSAFYLKCTDTKNGGLPIGISMVSEVENLKFRVVSDTRL